MSLKSRPPRPKEPRSRKGGHPAKQGADVKSYPASPLRKRSRGKAEFWELRLYVAGLSPSSALAFANIKKLCETHLVGQYRIEVVDLLENPKLSEGDQILAIPTLVRKLPQPVKKLIGDLSNSERVLVGLDIRPGVRGG